jgi:hypothetical protein
MSIYSAGVGQSAWDRLDDADTNKNSVFTRVFVEVIKTPGLDLQGVARETRKRVADLARSAGKVQTPGYYEQIDGEIFLAGPRAISHEPTTDTQEADFAAAMTQGTATGWDVFLGKHPRGPLADIARREREKSIKAPLAPPQQAARPPQPAVVWTAPVVPPPVPAPQQQVSLPQTDLSTEGVSDDELAWRQAKAANTMGAVKKFINDFPNSVRRHEADVLLGALEPTPPEESKTPALRKRTRNRPSPRAEPRRAPPPRVAQAPHVQIKHPSTAKCFSFNGERYCQ